MPFSTLVWDLLILEIGHKFCVERHTELSDRFVEVLYEWDIIGLPLDKQNLHSQYINCECRTETKRKEKVYRWTYQNVVLCRRKNDDEFPLALNVLFSTPKLRRNGTYQNYIQGLFCKNLSFEVSIVKPVSYWHEHSLKVREFKFNS